MERFSSLGATSTNPPPPSASLPLTFYLLLPTIRTCSGTGYIGSFTTLALLQHGYDVVVVDNLYNSSEVALDRIDLLCGRRPDFYKVDVTDEKALDEIFAKHPGIDSVIHFAALKVSLLVQFSIFLPFIWLVPKLTLPVCL